MLAAPARRDGRLGALGQVDPHGTAGRREHDERRDVGDLERGTGCGGRLSRGRRGRDARACLGEQGASRGAEALGDLIEFLTDQFSHPSRVAEQRLELGDLGAELVALGLQLDPAELGEPAQLELEDVVGLQHAEVEDVDQAGARLRRVVARPDQLDDLVDVEDRDQQSLDEVQPLLAPGQAVPGATGDDLDPVIEVDPQQLAQPEGQRSCRSTRATLLIEKPSSSGVRR